MPKNALRVNTMFDSREKASFSFFLSYMEYFPFKIYNYRKLLFVYFKTKNSAPPNIAPSPLVVGILFLFGVVY